MDCPPLGGPLHDPLPDAALEDLARLDGPVHKTGALVKYTPSP